MMVVILTAEYRAVVIMWIRDSSNSIGNSKLPGGREAEHVLL